MLRLRRCATRECATLHPDSYHNSYQVRLNTRAFRATSVETARLAVSFAGPSPSPGPSPRLADAPTGRRANGTSLRGGAASECEIMQPDLVSLSFHTAPARLKASISSAS